MGQRPPSTRGSMALITMRDQGFGSDFIIGVDCLFFAPLPKGAWEKAEKFTQIKCAVRNAPDDNASSASPLGASWKGTGVNFALYSRDAEGVELLLFDDADSSGPSRTVRLLERSGPVWHTFVSGVKPGQLYGYRVSGPYRPRAGHRFNAHKVLLDPYARAIGRELRWHESLYGYDRRHVDSDLSFSTLDSAPYAPLAAVVGSAPPATSRPDISWEDTIIYETHIKGLSRLHPDVPAQLRGSYLGLASEPVCLHLQRLGITAVELLPAHAAVQDERLVDRRLSQYWGYNTLSFFAPDARFAHGGPLCAVQEFRSMVDTLHDYGIEVILDVVMNHSGEGSHLGPTLAFRGLDNAAYYKQRPDNRRFLMDYTGCGNTLDTGNPFVLQLIMDSLRYWAEEMHVDGFRFDLASVLARERFDVDMEAPLFHMIQQDPVLQRVKLIAEPWDVGRGGYRLGAFPWQWAEWNDKYRDAVRRFWRGDGGVAGEFATRIAGSSDLFAASGRRPTASVNFVTAHDGFTLEDLVSYSHRRNEANLEEGRDGSDANFSSNGGEEGPTSEEHVLARRDLLKRSMLTTLFVSQGAPMLLGGDELSRTQGGNNNPYCQDNETNWYDWDLDERQGRFLEFVRRLIVFRKSRPHLRRRRFLTGEPDASGVTDAQWWHPGGGEMRSGDWRHAHAFGLLLRGEEADDLLIVCNAAREPALFQLPPVEGAARWTVAFSQQGPPERPVGAQLEIEPGEVVVLEAAASHGAEEALL